MCDPQGRHRSGPRPCPRGRPRPPTFRAAPASGVARTCSCNAPPRRASRGGVRHAARSVGPATAAAVPRPRIATGSPSPSRRPSPDFRENVSGLCLVSGRSMHLLSLVKILKYPGIFWRRLQRLPAQHLLGSSLKCHHDRTHFKVTPQIFFRIDERLASAQEQERSMGHGVCPPPSYRPRYFLGSLPESRISTLSGLFQ